MVVTKIPGNLFSKAIFNKYRLFAVREVRTEKYFPEVSEAARDRRSRDSSETEGKYFSVWTDLNGK